MPHVARSLVVLLLMTSISYGQTSRRRSTSGPTTQAGTFQPADDGKLTSTDHTITLDGKPLAYKATAGPLTIKDDNGKPRAEIFFVAYHTESDQKRPITFLFNGGPGAAAVWLHLGGFGPRVIDIDEKGIPVGPPFKMIDNQDTWLKYSDLVFVDPVGTGYSKPTGEPLSNFTGYRNDLASCSEFIRVYLNKYNRLDSPIYLAGESYGTTRCAGLAGYLTEHCGIEVSGVTLMSSVLDFSTIYGSPASDLTYETFLPTYTAVAWFHKKLSPDRMADMSKSIDAAKQFATDEYAPAMLKGAAVPADQQDHLADQLASFTGLPKELIVRNHLRIDPGLFMKSIVGDGHTVIGRYDGRITGYDPDAGRTRPNHDPSYERYLAAYSSAFNTYIRNDLKFENEAPYEVLTGKVRPWASVDEGGPLYVTDDLQAALTEHPRLRVLFVSGYYDLATPFYAADYTINRMVLPPDVRANVSHVYYPCGHMVYHNRQVSKLMDEEIGRFVSKS